LSFTVSDVEMPAGSLLVTATSSNLALVPSAGIVFGGAGANRTISITPATNQSGTATVTVTVSDGSLTANDVLALSVTAVNDAPTITSVADQTILQNTATSVLSFTLGDVETAAGSLVVTAVSSNVSLVPTANILLGGSGASRTVTVTPAANQTGAATITLTVSDGTLTAAEVFVLNVTSGATPTYLLKEGFEGTGFENAGWTKGGTPNADYTSTVLDGTQSLNTVGAQYIVRPFSYGNSFSMYLRARWNAWSDYHSILFWEDGNWGGAAGLWADDNVFHITHGSKFAPGTTQINANVTYHVWIDWVRGSGTNGTMQLFVSTTPVKPAVPEATVTSGTGAPTARMYVGPFGSGPNVIFDNLLVDDAVIGSEPPTGGDAPEPLLVPDIIEAFDDGRMF
jgi:hypothetical protein